MSTPYRGRFAPSPTGPLHFGSLLAAVGSYLQARRAGGQWLLRIEDLDPPRVMPGAADAILRTLEAFGLHWDGEPVFQSRRQEAYEAALQRLIDSGDAYPCSCSRKDVQAAARAVGPTGAVYPGTCRDGALPGRPTSWRLRAGEARIGFDDRLQGPQRIDMAAEIGDFVLRRADGIFAYHLASVVDDGEAGITEVVRGRDLLACTAPQILLQQRLALPTPAYLHLPLAVNAQGQKLSKQSYAPALAAADAVAQLRRALEVLGQRLPPEPASRDELWAWAIAHWDPAALPRDEVPG